LREERWETGRSKGENLMDESRRVQGEVGAGEMTISTNSGCLFSSPPPCPAP